MVIPYELHLVSKNFMLLNIAFLEHLKRIKMKKIKYLILIFVSTFCLAQTINVNYTEKRIISAEKLEKIKEFGADEEAIKPHIYKLSYSQGISFYVNDVNTRNVNTTSTSEKEEIKDDIKKIEKKTNKISLTTLEKWYYKEINNKIMLFNLYNAEKLWNGKDVLLNWNWQITNETRTISNYKCRKATSNYNGMSFTAWFTDEIPINTGPDKFDGLPGLILYVGTPYFEWEAISITIKKENTKIEHPVINGKTYTMNEVFSYVNKEAGKIKYRTETKTEGNTTTTTTTTPIR